MYLLEYLYTGTIQAVAQRSAAPGLRPATAFAAKQGNARVNKPVMIDLAVRSSPLHGHGHRHGVMNAEC